jgi:hypothetical protein
VSDKQMGMVVEQAMLRSIRVSHHHTASQLLGLKQDRQLGIASAEEVAAELMH